MTDSLVLRLDLRINRIKKRIQREPQNLPLRRRLAELLEQQEAALLDTSAIHAALDRASEIVNLLQKGTQP